jgi:hypothetical protein
MTTHAPESKPEVRAGLPHRDLVTLAELRSGTPFSFSISASGAAVLGRTELYPGADVATSGIPPMPAAWWLRPVSSACHVGAHNAVVWKRLYLRPLAASRSAVGGLPSFQTGDILRFCLLSLDQMR